MPVRNAAALHHHAHESHDHHPVEDYTNDEQGMDVDPDSTGGRQLLKSQRTMQAAQDLLQSNSFKIAHEAGMTLAAELGLDKAAVKGCWEAFKKYDQDESGELDMYEAEDLLRFLLGDLDDEVFEAHLSEIDKDGNSSVDFCEFLQLFKNLTSAGAIAPDVLSFRAGLVAEHAPMTATKGAVCRLLRKELAEEQSCKQLPWTALLFYSCVVSFFFRELPYKIHSLEKSIHFDLNENANFAFGGAVPFANGGMGHKSLYDVNTFADFWSWMGMGLCPLIFHNEWDLSEVRSTILTAECSTREELMRQWGSNISEIIGPMPPCPESPNFPMTEIEEGMYLYYNRVIGGLRLRQEHAENVTCGVSEKLQKVYGQPCYASLYHLDPDHSESLLTDLDKVNHPDAPTEWLLVPQSLLDVRKTLRRLEDENWASQATQKIELALPTYNAIENAMTVTYINLFVSRGGHFWKQVVIASVWFDLYRGRYAPLLADFFWFALTGHLFLRELLEAGRHWRQLGFLRGTRLYLNPSNGVDWISIFIGWSLASDLYTQYYMIGSLKGEMEEYDYSKVGGFDDPDRLFKFVDDIESAAFHSRSVRMLFGFYPLVIGARLFKAFSAQPRLALVTSTLQHATVDILHFGLVFLSILGTFAASGMALFGREDAEWSTFPRAVGSSMRVLMGDFNWDLLQTVGRFESGLWALSFNALVVNVMLNMLVAIILDAYVEVKSNMGHPETLYSQMHEIFLRWKKKRKGVSMGFSRILAALDSTDLDADDLQGSEDIFTQKGLCEQVKGLHIDEAHEVISLTCHMLDVEHQGEASISDAMKKINVLDKRTHVITKGIESLLNLASHLEKSTHHEENHQEKPLATMPRPESNGLGLESNAPSPGLESNAPSRGSVEPPKRLSQLQPSVPEETHKNATITSTDGHAPSGITQEGERIQDNMELYENIMHEQLVRGVRLESSLCYMEDKIKASERRMESRLLQMEEGIMMAQKQTEEQCLAINNRMELLTEQLGAVLDVISRIDIPSVVPQPDLPSKSKSSGSARKSMANVMKTCFSADDAVCGLKSIQLDAIEARINGPSTANEISGNESSFYGVGPRSFTGNDPVTQPTYVQVEGKPRFVQNGPRLQYEDSLNNHGNDAVSRYPQQVQNKSRLDTSDKTWVSNSGGNRATK